MRFDMDENVPKAVTNGLRLKGIDVLMVQDDLRAGAPDPEVLDRATTLGRVLFSQDDDLLSEANRRQHAGVTFIGIVYGHQLRVTIGQCIRDLELLAEACSPEEIANQVVHLPI